MSNPLNTMVPDAMQVKTTFRIRYIAKASQMS